MSSGLPPCDLAASRSDYNCERPYPDCHNPSGFQFSSLWIITNLVAACPHDPRLFDSKAPSLTEAACLGFVGSRHYTAYSGADIWSRVTTWKFPLVQLVAIFPRPPLSTWDEAFVLAHLVGNPIGTLKGLLLKFASCQTRYKFWAKRFKIDPIPQTGEGNEHQTLIIEQRSKALAEIVDSYDEWGYGEGQAVQNYLEKRW